MLGDFVQVPARSGSTNRSRPGFKSSPLYKFHQNSSTYMNVKSIFYIKVFFLKSKFYKCCFDVT